MAGSVSNVSSTCSEVENETSGGEEADIYTTDLEYTSTGKNIIIIDVVYVIYVVVIVYCI